MKRKIMTSTVLCPNTGCEWIGELSQVEKHRKDCLLEIVTCVYSECSLEISRNKLEEHMASECWWRECQCYYCEEIFPFCRKKVHEDVCRRFPVKCTKNCNPNQTIPREELNSHLENRCPLTPVECPFREIGCEEKVQRCQLDQHLESKTQVHLASACRKITEMSKKIDRLSQELAQLKGPRYKAMYDFDAADDDEVSFSEGDIIVEIEVIGEGWMMGKVERTGQHGLLPANYVERV